MGRRGTACYRPVARTYVFLNACGAPGHSGQARRLSRLAVGVTRKGLSVLAAYTTAASTRAGGPGGVTKLRSRSARAIEAAVCCVGSGTVRRRARRERRGRRSPRAVRWPGVHGSVHFAARSRSVDDRVALGTSGVHFAAGSRGTADSDAKCTLRAPAAAVAGAGPAARGDRPAGSCAFEQRPSPERARIDRLGARGRHLVHPRSVMPFTPATGPPPTDSNPAAAFA